MTIKITPEAVKERIAALESAGELSLKEQFYLEALRQLVAAMDSEPVADVVAWSSPNEERKCDIRWRRHDVEPGPLYRHAQPAPVAPVCTCPSGDGSLRWPCPVHLGNSPVIPDSCTWTFSNYDDHWSGTCGVEWIFPDGGPEENGVKFCPKCGKSVAVSATEGTEE